MNDRLLAKSEDNPWLEKCAAALIEADPTSSPKVADRARRTLDQAAKC
jgi:hypothetical protein